MRPSDRRLTPDPLLEAARGFAGGPIALDPCTEPDNPTGALRYFSCGGLDTRWWAVAMRASEARRGLYPTVWLNPPFSDRLPWDRRAGAVGVVGVAVLVLSGVDYSTVWWRRLCRTSRLRCELWRRWRFVDPVSGTPKEVSRSLCVWLVGGADCEVRFERAWSPLGGIVRPALPPSKG